MKKTIRTFLKIMEEGTMMGYEIKPKEYSPRWENLSGNEMDDLMIHYGKNRLTSKELQDKLENDDIKILDIKSDDGYVEEPIDILIETSCSNQQILYNVITAIEKTDLCGKFCDKLFDVDDINASNYKIDLCLHVDLENTKILD